MCRRGGGIETNRTCGPSAEAGGCRKNRCNPRGFQGKTNEIAVYLKHDQEGRFKMLRVLRLKRVRFEMSLNSVRTGIGHQRFRSAMKSRHQSGFETKFESPD